MCIRGADAEVLHLRFGQSREGARVCGDPCRFDSRGSPLLLGGATRSCRYLVRSGRLLLLPGGAVPLLERATPDPMGRR